MSSPDDREALRHARAFKIQVTTNTSQLALLQSLDVWQRLGLLSEAQISLTLTTSSHPKLLAGIDALLHFGLISDAKVRELALSLVCPLPQRTTPISSPVQTTRTITHQRSPFAPDADEAIPRHQRPSWIAQRLQLLQAELSLRWLLFLGVFMVVVSSGVLAASQWQNFPAAGQYGILLGYTLSFWGVSYWTHQQSNLRLTSQTLQIVTLLLVSVNFWAMDSFRLWHHPLNWIVVVIATVTLSLISYFLWKQGRLPPLTMINYLGLSYLHWGWGLPGFPLVAVYLGIGGTIASFYAEFRRSSPLFNRAAFGIVAYGIGILLFRAIFVIGLELQQLGLAIGAYGWFLCWISQKSQLNQESAADSSLLNFLFLTRIGGGLLFLGWLVSVGTFPWQAIAISGLSLWLFISRLQRFWQRRDLAAIFGIGLQTIWLFWRLIPSSIQTQLVTTVTQLTNSQNTPHSLLSLVLFPYLIFVVGLTDWLHRRQQRHLAEFGELIALFFATVLTIISSVNPLLRMLNLLNSTITLGIVTKRRDLGHNRPLAYLAHITGIATIIAAIEYLLPNLNLSIWAAILLTLMVAEWGFSIGMQSRLHPTTFLPHSSMWRDSAWHIGLILAGLSYLLLYSVSIDNHREWSLLWLITPLSLTGVAMQAAAKQQIASKLSVVALVMMQLLTLLIPGARLISLGVATGLMLVNTRYLRQLPSAAISVGFSLSFGGFLVWDKIAGFARLSGVDWFVLGAITCASLWLFRSWVLDQLVRARQVSPLLEIYARATDGWAIALCSLQLIFLTLHSLLVVYWRVVSPEVPVLIACLITMGAIAYRMSQPASWSIYALGWSLEIFTVEVLGFIGNSSHLNLAIANLALGLLAQLAGDWWSRKNALVNIPYSWHIIPLLYGILGAVLRWGTFTSWTGLSSLALALIFIGIGRRREEFKPLVYLAVFGVSVSAYEILFYQSQALATSAELIAMAALGTSIIYAYRVLSPWLIQYLHLSREELKVIAHLHWAWSSCLLIAATAHPVASSMILGFGIGAFLIQYAILQGRNHPQPHTGQVWVYLGFLEAYGLRLYWLSTPVAKLLGGPLVPWKSAIASVFAYFLYFLPWETWGWSKRPWQVAALNCATDCDWRNSKRESPSQRIDCSGFLCLTRHS